MEIYEDTEQEFRALLWLLKNAMKDETYIDYIRRNYRDPSSFDNIAKEYLDFIKRLVEMIYIESIDGEEPIPAMDLSPVGYFHRMTNQSIAPTNSPFSQDEDFIETKKNNYAENSQTILKNKDDESAIPMEPYEEETIEFIERSPILPTIYSEDVIKELIRFINYQIKHREIKIYTKEKFWEAAFKFSMQSKIVSSDMDRLIHMGSMFFRYGSNIIFQDKSTHTSKNILTWKKYRLAGDIYQHVKFYFPLLEKSDYQLRMIVGYILYQLGLLKNEDEFYSQHKGAKSWREYLMGNATNWIKKAYEFGFESYPIDEEE